MSHKLLILNPGSTSTKIGVFEDELLLFEETLRHTSDEIGEFDTIYDQFQFRKDILIKYLLDKDFDINSVDAVVGRGGLLKPMESGTYRVNEKMLEDLKIGVQGQHASNLGGIIASEIAKTLNVPAFIVDPVIVDEMEEVARISGVPEIKRKSIFHALNQKAVAKRYAQEIGKNYEMLHLIVAHMGGGVSVGVHKNGRVIDVNNALDGEGPFSPERSGGVPIGDLNKLCYSSVYSPGEMQKKISGHGGIAAYLNTNDFKEVLQKAEAGDLEYNLIYDAFIYQVAKEIGSCATVLFGKVDAIILTGGIAYGKSTTDAISERVNFIAPVVVYPGEDELRALAQGGLRVLRGEEEGKVYY